MNKSLHPKFLEAGEALQKLTQEHGEDAASMPEHQHLYSQLMKFAPEEFHQAAKAKARELGLIPPTRTVDKSGNPIYSIEQIAEHLGTSVEEVQGMAERMELEDGFYQGPVFPVQ